MALLQLRAPPRGCWETGRPGLHTAAPAPLPSAAPGGLPALGHPAEQAALGWPHRKQEAGEQSPEARQARPPSTPSTPALPPLHADSRQPRGFPGGHLRPRRPSTLPAAKVGNEGSFLPPTAPGPTRPVRHGRSWAPAPDYRGAGEYSARPRNQAGGRLGAPSPFPPEPPVRCVAP